MRRGGPWSLGPRVGFILNVPPPPQDGPVEAIQLRSISLLETAIAAKLVGVLGALQPPAGMISIPRTLGLVCGAPFVPAVKATVIVPLLSAVAVNTFSVALNCAPASAKMS